MREHEYPPESSVFASTNICTERSRPIISYPACLSMKRVGVESISVLLCPSYVIAAPVAFGPQRPRPFTPVNVVSHFSPTVTRLHADTGGRVPDEHTLIADYVARLRSDTRLVVGGWHQSTFFFILQSSLTIFLQIKKRSANTFL